MKAILSKPDDPRVAAGFGRCRVAAQGVSRGGASGGVAAEIAACVACRAKIGVIDRNGNGENHGINSDVVIHEAQEAGYRLVKKYDFVKRDGMDYFLVFTASQ